MGSRPIAGGDVVREAASLSAMAWQLLTLLRGLKAFSYGPLGLTLGRKPGPTVKNTLMRWDILNVMQAAPWHKVGHRCFVHRDGHILNEGYYCRLLCSESHSTLFLINTED